MMEEQSPLYAMYLRKSRADMEMEALGEGETLARHKAMLDKLAAKHEIHPSQITVYKEIVSGDSIDERPEMQKLLADVYAKKYKGVLVVEVERLARGNTKDQGEVADAFAYSSTHIITPAKVYDPNNEFDQEYFEFGLFMSRREYKTIRRRLEAGKLQSVQEGNFIGSVAPFGFDIVQKSKRDRYLAENPEKSQIVKMIFDWFTEDKLNVGKIAKQLTAMNIPSPGGKKDWHNSSVADILQNEHYIGLVRWKNREVRKEYIDGKLVKTNKRSRKETTQLYNGKHDGFITEEQFNKAKERFKYTVPVSLETELKNPLAGLLFCSDCGRALKFSPFQTKATTAARFLHNTISTCKKKSLPADQVFEALVETLMLRIEDLEFKMTNDTAKQDRIRQQTMIDAMEAELAKQVRKRERLFDSYEDGAYTKEEFIERKQRYNQTIEDLKKQIQEAKAANPEPVDYGVQISNIHAIIKCIQDPNIDAKSKNDFLKQFIEKITYDAIDFGQNKGGQPILEVFLK